MRAPAVPCHARVCDSRQTKPHVPLRLFASKPKDRLMLLSDIDIDKPASQPHEMTYLGGCRYRHGGDGGGGRGRGVGSNLMMSSNDRFGRRRPGLREARRGWGQHERHDPCLLSRGYPIHASDHNMRRVAGQPDLQGAGLNVKTARRCLNAECAFQRQLHEYGHCLTDSELAHTRAVSGRGPTQPIAPAGMCAVTKAQLVADTKTVCRSGPLRRAVFQHSHGREKVPATSTGPSAARGNR